MELDPSEFRRAPGEEAPSAQSLSQWVQNSGMWARAPEITGVSAPWGADPCAPIPVRFFWPAKRNLLKMWKISLWASAPKHVRSSSADEHPASLGAALAAAVQYRGHQSALQLAHRSGPARDRRDLPHFQK